MKKIYGRNIVVTLEILLEAQRLEVVQSSIMTS